MTINLDQYTNTLNVTDTATNPDLNVTTKGTGNVNLGTGNGTQFRVESSGSTATDFVMVGGSSTGRPFIRSASASGNIDLAISSQGTGAVRLYTNFVGQEQMRVSHTASAVNYVQVTGAATGGNPTISSQGSDTNINLVLSPKASAVVAVSSELRVATAAVNFFQMYGSGSGSGPVFASIGSDTNIDLNATSKGTGVINLNTGAGTQVRIIDSGGTAVNRIHLQGQATGFLPVIASRGSDTNLGMSYSTQGTGAHDFYTAGTNFTQQVKIAHTASAVNYVQVTGAATGGRPTLSAQGSDSSIGLTYVAKGTGSTSRHAFQTGSGTQFLVVDSGVGTVNTLQVYGSASGSAPVLSSQGSDTNIPLVLQPKGTGALQAQQTDSTATGGNARGANAVDWQTARGLASQVANGTVAVIGGGQNNTSSGLLTTVAGGFNNNASGNSAFIGGGQYNVASQIRGVVVGGGVNTAAGIYNFVGGGFTNSGTANGTVTTQSGTMNGTTAVTLSGSNASIKVGQYITGTSISADTYVAAISGTSLTLSQAASGSSTSTLSFYTPHGVVVGGGNNTATGSYSFIGGGGDAGTAGNRNVASGDWSTVGGGFKNTASGLYSTVVGGYGNTANNTSSFLGGGGFAFGSVLSNAVQGQSSGLVAGIANNITGNAAFIGAGYSNLMNGQYSASMGGSFGNARSIAGNHVFAANVNPIAQASGITQSALLVLAVQTTDATATILRSDSGAAGTGNQVILPNNSAYFFTGEVVAGVTGGGNTKGWTIEGVIKRGANAASTTLVGTPTVTSTYADAGASTWVIAVTADTTNGGLAVTFTGQAATTIRTVAKISTVEMTY